MKKRLLALALVVMMIISLLPVTAFAASPMPKLQMNDPNLSSKIDQYFNDSRTIYVYFEDVVSADDPTVVLGNKPVYTTTAQSDNYIKCAFDGSVATITFKNVYYKRTANHSSPIIQIVKNGSNYTTAFDVVYEFIGENYIEGNNAILVSENTGEVVVTGPGSLEMKVSQSYKKGLIWGSQCSQMTIRDANLNLVQEGSSSARYGIVSAGDILIENSDVSITSDYGYCLATRSGSTSNASTASLNDKSVTIRNSTFYGKATGQTSSCVIQSYHITFENSNVYLTHCDTNTSTSTKSYSVLMKAPTIIGDYSVKQAAANGYKGTVTWKDYDTFGLSPDDQLKRGETTGTLIRSINLEHKHTTTDCTKESTCTCQKVIPATEHTPGDEVIDTENKQIVVSCTVCGTEISRTAAACIHETTEVIEGYAATCTTDGKTNGTKCASCGEILKEQETIPAAHTTPEGAAATCNTGVNCSVCGVQVIAPNGHTVKFHYTGYDLYKYKYSIIPTCTEPGQSSYKSCTVCKHFFYWSTSSDELEAGKYTGYSSLSEMSLYEKPFGHAEGEPVLDETTNEWVTTCTRCNEVTKREPNVCKHPNAEKQTDCTVAVICPDCNEVAYEAKEHVSVGELTNCKNGVKCANCDQYTIQPGDHSGTQEDRPCGTHHICEKCGQPWGAKKGHKEVKVAAKDATCVEAGHVAYWTCANCDLVFSDAEGTAIIENLEAWLAEDGAGYIAPTGEHTAGDPVLDEAANEWVTSCSVCSKELKRESAACQHVEEIIPAVEATCTTTGLTEGKKCSKCGEILKAQEEVDKKAHTPKAVAGKPADCVNTGLTEGSVCEICGETLTAQEVIDALGHKEETIPAVEATCTTTGLTEGKKCSKCGEILKAQEEVDKKAHTPKAVAGKPADCVNTGLTEGSVCEICGETLTAQEVIDALGHKEETIPAVEATCTTTGLTEGKKCPICGETLVAQITIPVREHTPAEAIKENIVDADYNKEGSYELVVKCSSCGLEISRETVIIPVKTGAAAEANGVKYETLAEAIAAGNEVKLLADITADSLIKITNGQDVAIDLNGCSIVAAADREFIISVEVGGKLTINDATNNGGIINNNAYGYAIVNKGTLVVNGGNIVGDYALYNGDFSLNAVAILNGGTFSANEGAFYSVANCSKLVVDGATLNDWVNTSADFSLESGKVEYLYVGIADKTVVSGVATAINGGEVVALYVEDATCPVTKGSEVVLEAPEGYCWNASGVLGAHVYNAVVTAPDCLNGGYTTYTCAHCGDKYVADEVVALGHKAAEAVVENKIDATLNAAGSYDEVVYCSVCKTELSREAKVIPQLTGAVAEVGGVKYESLLVAWQNATANSTIKLLDNVDLTGLQGMYVPATTLTLDLNGKTLYIPFQALSFAGNGFTIKNGTIDSKGASYGLWIGGYADEAAASNVIIEDVTVNGGINIKNTAGVTLKNVVVNAVDYYAVWVEFDATGVVIESGFYNGAAGLAAVNASEKTAVTVKGGTFSTDVTAYCETGFHTVKAGEKYVYGAHAYEAVVTEPTCTAAGFTTNTCACGDKYIDNEVAAKGHTEETVAGKAATCTEAGLTEGKKCSVCGEILTAQEEIKALGHKAAEAVVENKIDATLNAAGSYDEVVYCSVCKTELSREAKVIPQLTGAVAEVNGEKFATVQEAVNAAEGKTVTLLANVDLLGARLNITTNCTLDLAGKTLTSKDGGANNWMAIYVQAGKTFTLDDTVGNGKVVSSCYGVYVLDGATFTMDGGTLKVYGNGTYDYGVTTFGATFIMNGGTIEARIGLVDNSADDVYVINDGAIIVDGRVGSYGDPSEAISVYYAESVTVNGGKFNSDVSAFIPAGEHMKCVDGIYTICDGKAKAAVKENEVAGDCTNNGSYDMVVYCECGKELSRATESTPAAGHKAAEAVVENKIDATLNAAGSYDEVVYCSVCKTELSREAKVIPQLTGAVAEVDGEKFATLAEAVAAGNEVKLIADAAADSFINATGVTIDLNGYTLTADILATIKMNGGTFKTSQYTMVGENGLYKSDDAIFTVSGEKLDVIVHSGTMILNQVKWYTGVGQTLKIEEDATFVIPEGSELYVNGSNVIVEGVAANFGTLTLANGAHLKGDVAGTIKMAGGTFETSDYVMIGATEGKYISSDAMFTIAADGTFDMTVISGTITLNDADWWTLAGQTLTIAENAKFVVPAGKNINVQGTVIVDGTAVVDGTVTLYNVNATVKAAEGLNVITNAGDKVWYTEGKYVVHNHTEEIIDAVAATCTEAGLTEGKKCTVCGEITVAQTVIAAKGHTEETVAGKEATCTEAGLTEGKKCSVCGETLVAQTEIAAKGHTEETVAGKEATCTEAGLTEGKKCTVCGEITVAQTEIAAKGHTEETVAGKEATCTEAGLTEGKKCTVCGEITVAQTEIAAKGHVEEIIPAVEATLNSTGLTEGKKCSVCDEILVAQKVVGALGGAVAEVDGFKYATLEEAIANANGQAVKLLSNFKNFAGITISTDVTIDLNGFYIAATDAVEGAVIVIAEGANVTLTGAGYVKVEYSAWEKFTSVIVNNKGTLTVAATLNGANLNNEGSAAIVNNGTLILNAGAEVTVKKAAWIANNGTVTKAESVDLAAPAGYHWNENVLEAHIAGAAVKENEIEATLNNKGSYDEVIYCSVCNVELSRDSVTVPALAGAVAEVAGTKYATLEDAIANANGETVKLLKNFKNFAGITISTDVTIDLNGFYIAATDAVEGAVIVIAEGANVTLTGAGYVKVEYSAWEKFTSVIVNNNGTLTVAATLNGANLNNEGSAAIVNNGTLTLNAGAEVTVKKAAWLANTGDVTNESGLDLVAPAGYHWNEIVLEAHIAGEETKENVKEATLNARGSYDLVVRCSVCNEELSRETVVTPTLKDAQAVVNGIKYETLEEAIANANGQTVKLLKNFKNFAGITISTDVTIDLNGYYIAATDAVDGAVIVIAEGANVTLTGAGYVKVEYSAWTKFTSIIQNNGTLILETTLNGANLHNEGAAAIVNNGELTLNGATITVKKAAEVIGNPAK